MTGFDCAGFDELLLEAWERCTDDLTLRASAAYGCVRKWLGRLTADGRRGPGELARLKRLVRALRAAANGRMSLDELLQPDEEGAIAAMADRRRGRQTYIGLRLPRARVYASRANDASTLLTAIAADFDRSTSDGSRIIANLSRSKKKKKNGIL
jgi:hypothetical protein